jgi:uncharacterized protein (DUF1778 family)
VTTKNERLEMRVSKADRDLIESAASIVEENVSDFTRSAAVDRAHQVLALAERTLMPAEQFDELLRSLDQADHAPTLAKAFEVPRRFKRG